MGLKLPNCKVQIQLYHTGIMILNYLTVFNSKPVAPLGQTSVHKSDTVKPLLYDPLLISCMDTFLSSSQNVKVVCLKNTLTPVMKSKIYLCY